MRVWILCWVLVLSANLSAGTSAELIKGELAKIELDRSWGLLIGDEIIAKVTLPSSTILDLASLPQRQKRHGAWLYLRDSELIGNRLFMRYQVVNVPVENRRVATPVFELRTADGGFINIPEAPLSIGSFLATENAGSNGYFLPRGDKILMASEDPGLQQKIWTSLVVLTSSLLIWLGWHFGFRPRHRLPFAHTLFELNKMRWLGRKNADKASRNLHHAFNRSAGTVLVASRLQVLWQQCPWLMPLQSDIESFYQQSAEHYFSASGIESKDFGQLLELARACRAREKMA